MGLLWPSAEPASVASPVGFLPNVRGIRHCRHGALAGLPGTWGRRETVNAMKERSPSSGISHLLSRRFTLTLVMDTCDPRAQGRSELVR